MRQGEGMVRGRRIDVAMHTEERKDCIVSRYTFSFVHKHFIIEQNVSIFYEERMETTVDQ